MDNDNKKLLYLITIVLDMSLLGIMYFTETSLYMKKCG